MPLVNQLESALGEYHPRVAGEITSPLAEIIALSLLRLLSRGDVFDSAAHRCNARCGGGHMTGSAAAVVVTDGVTLYSMACPVHALIA